MTIFSLCVWRYEVNPIPLLLETAPSDRERIQMHNAEETPLPLANSVLRAYRRFVDSISHEETPSDYVSYEASVGRSVRRPCTYIPTSTIASGVSKDEDIVVEQSQLV
jgi:hypothetical protein